MTSSLIPGKVLAMTALAIYLVGFACALLWVGLLAPLVLRAFGVRLAFGVWRLDRRNQQLTKTQYAWSFGVFAWGIAMFLFSTVTRYLEWKLLGDKSSSQDATEIILALLIWLATGWVFGVSSAPKRNDAERSHGSGRSD